jgi:CHASE2 domain-containing sensor protein
MDVTAGLVSHVIRRPDRVGLVTVVASLVALAVAVVAVLAAGHPLPATDPIIVAPLRW